MAKPNKFFGNSPNPAVALPAWGMLIMALALVFLPSLRTAALILYAADWLALGIAALTAKRKQSLVNYWGSCVPIVVAIVLLNFGIEGIPRRGCEIFFLSRLASCC